jgi:hypothetical protein
MKSVLQDFFKEIPSLLNSMQYSELSSLRSQTSPLGNSTIAEIVIRGFGEKDVLSPKE